MLLSTHRENTESADELVMIFYYLRTEKKVGKYACFLRFILQDRRNVGIFQAFTMNLGQKVYRMTISISAKLPLYRNVLVECNLEKYNNMLEIVLGYTLQPIFTISEIK